MKQVVLLSVLLIKSMVSFSSETLNLISAKIFDDAFFLSLSSSQSANLWLAVQDITGRILHKSQISTLPGINKKEIPIGDLDNGIYIITLNGVGGTESVKVVKQ